MLAAQQRAGDVDVHRREPIVERELEEREHLGDAGAVDQHVAAAVLARHLLEGASDRLGRADVDLLRGRPAAGAPDALGRCARLVEVDVGNDHVAVRSP